MRWFLRLAFTILPKEFRARHKRDLLDLYHDLYWRPSRFQRTRFCVRVLTDVMIAAVHVRVRSLRERWFHNGRVRSRWTTTNAVAYEARHAVRSLLKSPGFTVLAVLSLALGIGPSLIVWGALYAANYEPLPYDNAERLVQLFEIGDPRCAPDCTELVPGRAVTYWQQNARAFDALAVSTATTAHLKPDDPNTVWVARVSPGLLPILGAQPVPGRTLTASDFAATAPAVALLGHTLWTRVYGSDPGVLGKTITIDSIIHTIVGVLPSRFTYPGQTQVWLPLKRSVAAATEGQYRVLARLRPGVDVDQANRELARRSQQASEISRPTIATSIRAFDRNASSQLWIVLGVFAVVLLIACANVAALFLVRALRTHRDVIVRAALGASRWRLAGRAIIEGVIVAFLGGVLGVILATWGRAAIERLIERYYAYPLSVTLDSRVLGLGLAASVIIGVLVGLAPLLQARHGNLHLSLREAALATPNIRRGWLRQALVASEIAGAFVMLTTASLLSMSFLYLQHYDLGYNVKNLAWGDVTLRGQRFEDSRQAQLVAERTVGRLRGVPGIQAATVWMVSFPRRYASFDELMAVEGAGVSLTTFEAVPPAVYHVDRNFFDVMGLGALSGRSFDNVDHRGVAPVAVVNEEAARLWWPAQNPLGKRFKIGPARSDAPWLTVVGTVANTHLFTDAAVWGAEGNPGFFPLVFTPLAQAATPSMLRVAIRANGDASTVIPTATLLLNATDPDMTIRNLREVRRATSSYLTLARVELNTYAVSGLALFGVFLALIGVYAVVSEAAQRRTHELGVRIALGATRSRVIGTVLHEGTALALLGVVIGVAGSLAIAKVLQSLLYGVSAADPVTLVVVSIGFLSVVLAASYVPCRRAIRIDVVRLLKAE